jgi:hypothetical protein
MRRHFYLRMPFDCDSHYKLTHIQLIVAKTQQGAAAALARPVPI